MILRWPGYLLHSLAASIQKKSVKVLYKSGIIDDLSIKSSLYICLSLEGRVLGALISVCSITLWRGPNHSAERFFAPNFCTSLIHVLQILDPYKERRKKVITFIRIYQCDVVEVEITLQNIIMSSFTSLLLCSLQKG